jgi:hypothetical protein
VLDEPPTKYFHPENLNDFEEGLPAQKAGWRQYADHHNVSGWIINDLSDPLQRTLSFPMLTTGAHPFDNLLVVVLYLKSYVGMGAAELIVCGVSTNVILDGLYVDHKTNRVSVPMMSASQLYDPQIKACLALPLQKRTVEIVYRPDIATDPDGVRQHKKMKILSVEVCKSFIISIVSSFPVMNILVLFSTSLLSTFNLTLLLSETAIVTSIVTISMWETMCCNGQDSSYSFGCKA